MRALVTGGAGFIGSHVVDRLAAAGNEVLVVDDLSAGDRSNLAGSPGARLEVLDVGDPATADLIAEVRPEVVLHLAAQIDVRVSVADPVLDAQTNIIGTLRILEAARTAGTRKVVVASSGGCVYGDARVLPIKESARGRPVSPYGISKRVLHDYLAFYRSVHGLRYVVLALSNVYGPRQDPHGEAGVVAIFLRAMLEGRDTTIYGDGSQTRDFVYVGDVADAFIAAVDAGEGVYNVGTGTETTVGDLWRACAEVAGAAGRPRSAPAREGELQRSALDASRARRDLGWRPTVDLREGLRRTAEHIGGRIGAPVPRAQ